jgi:hypothetical protein
MLEQQPEVKQLHNTESGRLFMIGSGPSLLPQMDILPRLRGERTWTINKYPLWEGRPLTPNFYSVSETNQCDRHGIQRFRFPDIGPEMRKFAIHWDRVKAPGFTWVVKDTVSHTVDTGSDFQGLRDELKPLPNCYNGFLTAMQLALWMGFRQFYFVGNDMTPTGYAWEPENPRENFLPRQLRRTFKAYETVRSIVEPHGVSMVDCTPEGNLSKAGILEYRSLEEVLDGANT